MADYQPVKGETEIYKDVVWTVNDPWLAQDVATFTDEALAKRFAKWYRKHYQQ